MTPSLPPDPRPADGEPDPEKRANDSEQAWEATSLSEGGDWGILEDPVFQDGIRRLQLLEQAKNLRHRMEVDLERGWAAGRQQDRRAQWSYLQRALWNLRAAHRLQMEAGEGLVPASPNAEPSLDLPFRYWGFQGTPSCCRIRVFEPKGHALVVLATELPDNPGTSITNFAAQLATQIGELLAVPLESLLWVEQYPECGPQPHEQESFALVSFTRTPHGLSHPSWRSLSPAEVANLIGGKLAREEPPQGC